MRRIPANLVIAFVYCYQIALRPFLVGSCRYCPSCSEFMIEAVRRHGAWRGGWMGLKRIGRCHAFGGSGYDSVP